MKHHTHLYLCLIAISGIRWLLKLLRLIHLGLYLCIARIYTRYTGRKCSLFSIITYMLPRLITLFAINIKVLFTNTFCKANISLITILNKNKVMLPIIEPVIVIFQWTPLFINYAKPCITQALKWC